MKNVIGIVILILLAAFTYVLVADVDLFGSADGVYRDFEIRDTAKVDQIFISEAEGNQILLTRRNHDQWMVNGKFPARPDGINLILKTLHDIKVQQTVSKRSMPRVIKRLASNGRKVEFYMDGKDDPEKVWYIGDPTASRVGTYMLLEKDGQKSKEPLVTHLLMERGHLKSRFFADTILWKDRIIYKGDPKKIQSIEVRHKYDTISSFKIEKVGEADFAVTNLDSEEKIEVPNELAIPYFKQFSGIYYEYIDMKSPEFILDSIYNSEPRHLITIQLEDGKSYVFKTFNMPVKEGSTLGERPIDYHPERMYAYSSYMGEQNSPVVQNLTFDPLTPGFELFKSSTTVEK
jgi:hypothetical protein